jgi:ribonuclease R
VTATLVATVHKRGRFWAAEPHFPAIAADGAGVRSRGAQGAGRMVLASNRVLGGGSARVGQLVLVRLAGGRGGGRAQVVRVIGSPDVARDAIEGLLLHHGLARGFTAELERAAERAGERGKEQLEREVAQGARRDLRGLATFTIDPVNARDFDDAISAEPEGPEDCVRVWVHIADVSAYVQEGSVLDRAARERGTSVYAPGTVEPMLPVALSNHACSLRPALERAALTVEMDFRAGRMLRSAFYRSLICSDARLDYEQVDRIFAGREQAREPWGRALAAARDVSAALGAARDSAGGLELQASEPEFRFDAEGNVSAVLVREQTESHRLIEQLMIAANEAVAKRLAQRAVPCLYRVHERPEPASVRRLVEQLASLGVPTPPLPEPLSSSQAGQLLGETSQLVERHVQATLARRRRHAGPWGGRTALTSLILRSLQQAYYSPRNIGHAGLRSDCYCHFTSPIRRYPDLVCHRALLSTLGGPERAPRGAGLGELGEWSSERERAAMSIERAGDDLARCFALEKLLYEEGWEQSFMGEVAGVISAGAFVAFGDGGGVSGEAGGVSGEAGGVSGEAGGVSAGAAGGVSAGEAGGVSGEAGGGPLFEGMLPVRRLRMLGEGDGGEWWELDEQETMLRGETSGAAVRLGDGIAVKVGRVDTVRGRVDLVPAS